MLNVPKDAFLPLPSTLHEHLFTATHSNRTWLLGIYLRGCLGEVELVGRCAGIF